MNSRRVRIITDWPELESYRDIQIFLRFANFYRRFIHRYSTITALIIDLLIGMINRRKKEPFDWTDGAKIAFSTLKVYFTTTPFL